MAHRRPAISGIDNDTRRIDRVRLGAVAGVDTTTNGTTYFDAFESRRSTYIGPMPSPVVTTTINYVYDPLYRLKQANYSDGRYFHYTYDAVGNRLTEEKCAVLPCGTPITNTYVYDIANRLTSVNGQTYQWDNNGNLLNDGTSTYAYDAANRLTSVTQGTTLSSYSYNGLGDRLSQTVDSVTTNYVLDLNAGLTQVLSDGTNTYLYGNGRIGELQPTGFAYHLGDALGSVRQLTDASGGVTLAREYEPYGTVLNTSGTGTTTFAFTGEALDASGLLHLRARYYAPSQGRFLTADPWPADTNEPMSYNSWLYVYSDPVNSTDPSGMIPGGCGRIKDPEKRAKCQANKQQVKLDYYAARGWDTSSSISPTATATCTPTPTATPQIEWLAGDFTITHYTFALESDPIYANDQRVSANGLPPENRYKYGFLYGARGILLQGTGLAEDGNYITIDWTRGGPQGTDTYFTYGIGGSGGQPVAWETVATGDNRLPNGTRIVIEAYPDRVFTVNDTGGGVGQSHIDVFVGAITIAEADQLGTLSSRVGIVR